MVSRSVVSSRAAVTEVKKVVKKVAKKPVKKVVKKAAPKKAGKSVDIFFGLFGDPDTWTKKRPSGPTEILGAAQESLFPGFRDTSKSAYGSPEEYDTRYKKYPKPVDKSTKINSADPRTWGGAANFKKGLK